jgi:type IV pilus assembly protein PilB
MILTKTTEQKISQFLLSNKIIDPQKLKESTDFSSANKQNILEVLINQGTLSEDDAIKILGLVLKVPYIDLKEMRINDTVLSTLDKKDAEVNQAVPFALNGMQLSIAMLDPTNLQIVDFLTKKTGLQITVYITTKGSITSVLNRMSGDVSSDVDQALKNDKAISNSSDEDNLMNEDAPITRALNTIIEEAVKAKASDIHVEPRESELKIRFRVDGILFEAMTLPKAVEPALISRIKIMAKLKIDEHRIPQDGEAQVVIMGRKVDFRIAIAPITNGEQVVIRILDKSSTLIDLEHLGYRGRSLRLIREGISKPHGMVLSTGPTGSGKSTTLYAVIQEVKNVSINIVTLEDPVEYKMDGINQMQVNTAVGLTFASGLRSILRQDPNVVMVGEIRDQETAGLAVQAALTGHLVLSTLHTNSAAGVLPRFLDMGIEPFLVASTVNTCIGQRLVRRICEKCKYSEPASQTAVDLINRSVANILPKNEDEVSAVAHEYGFDSLPIYNPNSYIIYKGKGCQDCTKGYAGRIGIFEIFGMSPQIEELLVNKATTNDIQNQAMAEGMITMQQDGILKVLASITTLDEIARVASDY